jgi:c-di-AMP phosphodiesterase-like protein
LSDKISESITDSINSSVEASIKALMDEHIIPLKQILMSSLSLFLQISTMMSSVLTG